MVRRIKRAAKRVANFRSRFDEISSKRTALMTRLENVPEPARVHPAYKNVRELLGPKFLNSALAKRAAVLQSAEWLLNVLETIAPLA